MNVILKNPNRIKTFKSKFNREIGDEMRIEGEFYKVIYVCSEEEVQLIMRTLKSLRDKKIRNQRRIEKAEEALFFSKIIKESIDDLNEDLPKEFHLKASDLNFKI